MFGGLWELWRRRPTQPQRPVLGGGLRTSLQGGDRVTSAVVLCLERELPRSVLVKDQLLDCLQRNVPEVMRMRTTDIRELSYKVLPTPLTTRLNHIPHEEAGLSTGFKLGQDVLNGRAPKGN